MYLEYENYLQLGNAVGNYMLYETDGYESNSPLKVMLIHANRCQKWANLVLKLQPHSPSEKDK